jgi:dTDP-4-dehydrorhamnose reductase
MKKILITGANGFLGQHLCVFLLNKGYDIVATGRGICRIPIDNINYYSCDLTKREQVAIMMDRYNPPTIIHTAALSKPDECNENKELCISINIEATRNLLENSAAHFIYVSTDFIFGENGPHAEDEPAQPLNFYGESKWQAEQLVRETKSNATIVRPVFIYGETWAGLRGSFLHWVKNNLEQHKPIKVVSDQLRTPTYVQDICKGIQTIIDNEVTGTFHFAGNQIISPYEMAVTTARVLGLDTSLIEKVTADTFPEPVKRAKRSGLKIEKAQRELGYEPVDFDEGVRRTFGLSD